MERDAHFAFWLDILNNFNSHAHVERDYREGSFFSHPLHFNSHAHVERDYFRDGVGYCKADFNSHAHVERDTFALELQHRLTISTHTLTWSVTNCLERIYVGISISTHTLTWSVTCFGVCFRRTICYFNSHAHVERDKQTMGLSLQSFHFNSHAHVERDRDRKCANLR